MTDGGELLDSHDSQASHVVASKELQNRTQTRIWLALIFYAGLLHAHLTRSLNVGGLRRTTEGVEKLEEEHRELLLLRKQVEQVYGLKTDVASLNSHRQDTCTYMMFSTRSLGGHPSLLVHLVKPTKILVREGRD